MIGVVEILVDAITDQYGPKQIGMTLLLDLTEVWFQLSKDQGFGGIGETF